jgi:hypothetical protein
MTQLNTPYPSTAYLTGFLRSRGISAVQEDLALALVLRLFSRDGLTALRESIRGAAGQGAHATGAGLRARVRALSRHDRSGGGLPAGARSVPGASHRRPPLPARRPALRAAGRLCRRRTAATRWPGPSAPWACRTARGTSPRCTSTTWPTCCARRSTRASSSCATPNRWRRASPPSSPWRRRWPRRPNLVDARCAT